MSFLKTPSRQGLLRNNSTHAMVRIYSFCFYDLFSSDAPTKSRKKEKQNIPAIKNKHKSSHIRGESQREKGKSCFWNYGDIMSFFFDIPRSERLLIVTPVVLQYSGSQFHRAASAEKMLLNIFCSAKHNYKKDNLFHFVE